MNIPSYINQSPVDENGNWTPEWANLMTQLLSLLQTNLSDEGYVLPQQDTANIAKLTGAQSTGAILYDSSTNEIKGNLGGTWKTFTLT